MSDKKKKHLTLMNMGLILAGIFLIGNGLSQIAYADDLFVKTDGSDTACTQGEPCALLTALGQVADSDTVYIAEGTYTGTDAAVIMVTNSISVYGGWDGTPTGPVVLDPETYITTVDGEETRRCAQVTAPVTVNFNGFTMTNGRHNEKGGGLYTQNADITLDSMIFYRNAATDPGTDYSYGGGAMIEGGSLLADGCTFRGNSTHSNISPQGGGLAIFETLSATLQDCLFEDNDSWSAGGLYFIGHSTSFAPLTIRRCNFTENGWGNSVIGYSAYEGACLIANASASVEDSTFIHNQGTHDRGAIRVSGSELVFARNIISGNSSGRTSGFYLNEVSNFTLTNNFIVDNESTYSWLQYPSVYIQNSSGQLFHNTFARNSGEYGIQLSSGANVTLTNTILAAHTVGIFVDSGCTATMDATLWGAGAWANGTDWDGTGTINTGTINIWDDPDFVDPDNSDYHISRESAAIDTGVDIGVTTDIDNDIRPLIDGYDIGADEYNPLTTFCDELAVDFSANGLWHYDGSSWTSLAGWNPDGMVDWTGGLAVDFDTYGAWNYDGTTWSQLAGWNPEDGIAWNSGLAVDFGPNGLWNYDGSSWTNLAGWNPDGMGEWTGGLAVNFGAAYGLWNYDGTTWTQLAGWEAEYGIAWNNGLAIDFGGNGLWYYDGSSWTSLAGWNPDGMVEWTGGLAVDFDTYGTWNYDGSSWTQLAGWNPEDDMVNWTDGLAVDFGSNGLWSYDGSSWTSLATWNPEEMEAWANGLAVDFGASYGLWNYDGSSWTSLAGWNPDDMIDVDLY